MKRKRQTGKPTTLTDEELLLRENVSGILCHELNRLGWSQKTLATKSGFSQQYISLIMHCKANCSVGTVGRLLFALGVDAHFVERTDENEA